jgi:hypothetical protein
MPYPPRPISPALVTEARRLYEDTNVPVRDIAALVGLSERTLYTRIHKWKWRMRRDRVPDFELDQAATIEHVRETPLPQPEADRSQTGDAGLTERLQRAVERELTAVETLLAKLGAAPGDADAERSARTLAMLSRVLRELARLQRDEKEEARDDSPHEYHDLDAFRRELAERLDRLRQQRDAG